MGLSFCNHCGALWDENHEKNGCPVMGTTARILGADDKTAERIQKSRRHRLREWLRPVTPGRQGS